VLAPAVLVPTEAHAEESLERGPRGGLGLDPTTLRVGDLVVPTAGQPGKREAGEGKQFQFHGFLRIPLRLGFGDPEPAEEGEAGAEADPSAEHGTRVNVPPRVPDASYTDWRYLNSMGGPWTELHFAYGDPEVSANVSIAAYDVTDASYGNPSAQLGINHAFLSFRFPEMFGPRGGIVANVGAFSNRYGAAGRYSAGKYETYLFGATHVAGETLAAAIDVADHVTLHAEQGFGAKLEPTPFSTTVLAEAPYLPYPGPVEQGTTMLAHAHVGATYWRYGRSPGIHDALATAALHFMTTMTLDAEGPDERDGRVTVVGGDIKLTDSFIGPGYVGYAHHEARDVLRLAGALETLHSLQGWNLSDNYFGPEGSGTIDSVLFQYSLSIARLLWHPKPFYGQARDLQLSAFGMYNEIASDDPDFDGPTSKFKVGGEATYTPLGWFGLSTRYDLVQPDLDDNTASFHVVSPKLILRSEFISHEQVVLQYSRYFYGDAVTPVYPNEAAQPQPDVFKLEGIMWW